MQDHNGIPSHDPGQRRGRRRRRRRRGRPEGGAGVQPPGVELTLEQAVERITPFDLFSAYHLGLLPDGRYRLANHHEVARRFSTSTGVLDQLLRHHAMDAQTVAHARFDLGLARLDMEVVPEGISRREVARQLFDEYQELRQRS